MQHFEFRLLAGRDAFLVKRRDVAVSDAESRGVKLELRLFVGRYADADFVISLHVALIDVELTHLIEDGYAVVKSFVEKLGDKIGRASCRERGEVGGGGGS